MNSSRPVEHVPRRFVALLPHNDEHLALGRTTETIGNRGGKVVGFVELRRQSIENPTVCKSDVKPFATHRGHTGQAQDIAVEIEIIGDDLFGVHLNRPAGQPRECIVHRPTSLFWGRLFLGARDMFLRNSIEEGAKKVMIFSAPKI